MEKINKIKAVVFDMDGVLFDTEKMFLDAWETIGKEKGILNVEESAKKCIGLSTADSVALLKDIYGKDFPVEKYHGLINELVRRRIESDGMPVKKGAREILEYLYSVDFIVGLASSTVYDKVIEHLERAGMRKYFRVIVGGDMIAHSKPDPEIYRTACRQLGVEPSETAAVEDSKNGIISAHRAGMIPLLVPDLVEPTEEMLSMSQQCFESLVEAKDFLKRSIEKNTGMGN